MKEFRFVVNEEILKKLNIDSSKAKDFIDYYLARNKRVRHFLPSESRKEEFLLIVAEPGMTIKRKVKIGSEEAKNLISEAELIVKKKGIGHLKANGTEGYAERVSAFKAGEREPIFEEIQIEFEVGEDKMKNLEKAIKPLSIIKKGIFDYISERI